MEDRDSASKLEAMKQFFVVGNSRSGTTMMGRILGRNDSVFTFNELHFFEQLWSPQINPQVLSSEKAKQLAARLLTIQRDGYYTQGDSRHYAQEAAVIVQGLSNPITPPYVYAAFLNYEANRHGKSIACDQTPRNVYYLHDILELYPQAYIVNIIRDSRDVLLSQKHRWRRRFLGGHSMPLKEVLRSWANYHPVTISLLWNSGIRAGDRFADHPRVFQLRFEDVLEAPEGHVRELCASVGLEFHPEMLQVPQVGSSHRKDQRAQMGINPTLAGRWQRDGRHATDMAICQWITNENLTRHGYAPTTLRPNPLALCGAVLTWSIKTSLALLLNFNRTRSLVKTVEKRLKG
jgi:hypothetical protein